MARQSYLLDNAWARGRARLDAVEEFLDPGTIHALSRHVLPHGGVRAGWRCLEVGAGGGSIAHWLAERAGAGGCVVATDIDTIYLDARAASSGFEARRHDIARDPLPTGAYDLIHTRLVLEHIPERDAVLAALAEALRPGGWLVVEAVDYASALPVSALGADEHARSQSLRLREFEAAGAKTDYGRHVPAAMRALGLVNVENEARAYVMRGGSAGARWFALSMEQLRGRLTGPGKLTDAEIDAMLGFFDNPDWAAISPMIVASWGQRRAD